VNPPPKFIRVFLVEDSPPDERLVTEMLKEHGGGQFIICGVFRRLEEAIRGLEAVGSVDIVLLDLSLPDSRGIDTFLRLSQAAPDQTVVVLSGYDDEDLAMETVRQGAQDYLVKYELTWKLLIHSIHYAIERKRVELALKATREDLEKRVAERTHALTEVNKHLSSALDQLKTTQDIVIQQERLHAMERMAEGVAHDFNNALSPVLAHSEWLLRKPAALADEASVKKALLSIHESAKHCAEVIVRLREFCRERDEFGVFETLDLTDAVQEAIRLTQPSWKDQAQMRGSNIRIETHFASVPKIHGTKEELVELFVNLIINSVDAIPKNGVITLRIFQKKDRVVASVADNGVGMSEEVEARCMEPFFTTKSDKGAGLGLGVVYGISQRHRGEIHIESAAGKGTEVTVSFPVCQQPAASLTQAQPTNDHLKLLSGLRILAVEDEPNIREILGIYLAEDGHQVELAAEGAEALQKFAKGRFDLLLTDYSMPNMNGDHLAAAVRAADPDIRIALLTGFGSQLPQGAPLRLEVDAIISKPFTFETLRQGITEAMGR